VADQREEDSPGPGNIQARGDGKTVMFIKLSKEMMARGKKMDGEGVNDLSPWQGGGARLERRKKECRAEPNQAAKGRWGTPDMREKERM